ncbi:MAG: hypothetical protein IT452_23335 [Planctomycetia bacterium]|nr:hypothetical protein [Planctomycetia bacterium]
MNRLTHELVAHRFCGARWPGAQLEIDDLAELQAYKKLVVETALHIWRGAHPEKKQVPADVRESLQLHIAEIRKGSAEVPILCHAVGGERNAFGENGPGLLHASVDLVASVAQAAEEGTALPPKFPRSLLSLFDDYGKTLREGERFEHVLKNGETRVVRFSQTGRKNIAARSYETYRDRVDVVAQVVMARVSKPRMAVSYQGRDIEAPLPPEWEERVLRALANHKHSMVRVIGEGQFEPDGRLKAIVEVAQISDVEGARAYDKMAKPIWEQLVDESAKLPPETFDVLPHDKPLDQVLYRGRPS